MFNRAIEWGVWLRANPTAGIKKLPENNERYRWLSEKEQEKLLLFRDHSNHRYGCFKNRDALGRNY